MFPFILGLGRQHASSFGGPLFLKSRLIFRRGLNAMKTTTIWKNITMPLFIGLLLTACSSDPGTIFTPPDPPFPPCFNSIAPEGAAKGTYRMWSHTTGVSIADVAISDRGWRAVAGGQNNNIYYFGRSKAAPLFTYATGGQVNGVDISQEGSAFVAGSGDGKIYFFECDASKPAWVYDTNKDVTSGKSIVEDVSIDHWGRFIAAVSQTRVYLFKRTSGTPILNLSLNSNFLATVEVSGLGTHLVVGTRPEGNNKARVFFLDKTKLLWTYSLNDLGWGPSDLPTPVAVNFDGSVVAAGGRDNRIHLWTGGSGTPLWTYLIAADSPVFSVDLSYDGSQLVATGNWTLYFYENARSASPTPTYTHDGTRGDPSPFFAQPQLYGTGSQGTTGSYGVGNFLRASAISGTGSYILAAEANNYLAFSYYRYDDRLLRSYDLDDTVGCVDISPDGSWVMLGGTFSGIIRRFEVAPLEIIDVPVPLTYRIIDDDINVIAQIIGGTKFNVQYSLLKPGRAATLKEDWEMWGVLGGVLIPPQNILCTGAMTWSWTHSLADGNVEMHGSRQISPPQCLESSISSIDMFVLHAEANDQPTNNDLSDDSATLATIQLGSP